MVSGVKLVPIYRDGNAGVKFPCVTRLAIIVKNDTRITKTKNILSSRYESHKTMTTIALKKLLINRIAEINDVSFLNAIKTILDTKNSDSYTFFDA